MIWICHANEKLGLLAQGADFKWQHDRGGFTPRLPVFLGNRQLIPSRSIDNSAGVTLVMPSFEAGQKIAPALQVFAGGARPLIELLHDRS